MNAQKASAASPWLVAAFGLTLGHTPQPGLAQATVEAALTLELNKASDTKDGCQLIFVATNRLGHDLNEAAFEFVLFDKDDLVARMAVFNFKDLPQAQSKVRQFTIDTMPCDAISRVLINDVAKCGGSDDANECMAELVTASRSDVRFEK